MEKRKKEAENESGFARLFLWTTGVKITMGMLFTAFVLLYLLLGLVAVQAEITLNFFVALEMAVVAFLIGIFQQVFLAQGDIITVPRSVLWVLCSTGATVVFARAFHWFAGFALWCEVLFYTFTALAVGMMAWYLHVKLTEETRQLNEKLAQFQAGRNSL